MKNLFRNLSSSLKKNYLSLAISILVLPTSSITNSVQAAERIYASYSILERSIPISSLENYARKGVIDDELAIYTQYIKPEQLQELRRILLSPIKMNPVAISQFLYTQQGEFLLRRLGEVIKAESRQPRAGFHALRASLILAASEPRGFTLLNLMRKFPSNSIHIDLERSMGIAAQLEKMVKETDRAIAAVSQKSNIEAGSIQQPINLSQVVDLRRQGKFTWRKNTLKLFDTLRNRFLLTDVYLPNVQNRVPVIVISHGLGSDSSNFQYLAEYLAKQGFAVVVPNHPGSDTKQLQSLLAGSTSEVAQPDEFQDRPLDVKYILDKLEEFNKSDSSFRDRLNLQQVGIFGQSFGGYTALALAGAQLNFPQLKKDCNPKVLKDTWNVSLLLQCRALEMKGITQGKEYNLRDERIKAVIAVNPITSSVFGEKGLSKIQIPVMIVASSDDTIAPALNEQIQPFAWLPNAQKYLAVLSGGSHFSVIDVPKNSKEQIVLPSEVVGLDPVQARIYMNLLSLPFFQTYIAKNPNYLPKVNAAFAKAISTQPLTLSLVQSLTKTELKSALDGKLPEQKR